MPLKKSTLSAIIILVSLMTIIGLSGLSFLFQNKKTQTDTNNNNSASEQVLSRRGAEESGYKNIKKISLTTKDNVVIAANLYETGNPLGWLILVHMLPATKESYADLAQRFQNLGYESIVIDLRGHGESGGGPNGYKNFSNSDHQKSISDLEAAADYLIKERGAAPDRIYFIGASIGANLSLQYISEHPEFGTAVGLSAGTNYFGINTLNLVKNLKSGQRLFLVSAKDDERVSDNYIQTQAIFDAAPAIIKKEIKIYATGGHGTDIFINQPDLMSLIVEFIKGFISDGTSEQ